MKGVRSLREMTRLLNTDQRLRKLCLVRAGEAAYPRSVLSRFIQSVGEEKLTKIIEEKVVNFLNQHHVRNVDAVFDASFIKAWSTRDPLDNQKGYSDTEARVGRAGRTFGLGYKLHLSIDSKTMLPLTCVFAYANQNEQKHSLNLLEKTRLILKQSATKLRSVIADSQYSDNKLRNAVGKTVIPYRANQKRDIKGLLSGSEVSKLWNGRSEKRISQKTTHRSSLQLPKRHSATYP